MKFRSLVHAPRPATPGWGSRGVLAGSARRSRYGQMSRVALGNLHSVSGSVGMYCGVVGPWKPVERAWKHSEAVGECWASAWKPWRVSGNPRGVFGRPWNVLKRHAKPLSSFRGGGHALGRSWKVRPWKVLDDPGYLMGGVCKIWDGLRRSWSARRKPWNAFRNPRKVSERSWKPLGSRLVASMANHVSTTLGQCGFCMGSR